MAPVKRNTTTAQRETRSTRSAAVARKNASTAEKGIVSPIGKAPGKAASTTAAPRVTKKTTRSKAEELEADIDPIVDGPPQLTKTVRGRTTKTATAKPTTTTKSIATKTIGAGTRRRIKVTPLAGPEETVSQDEPVSTRVTSKESAAGKPSSTRSRKTASEALSKPEQVTLEAGKELGAQKTRTTRKTVSKVSEVAESKDTNGPPKGRGRPKKAIQDDDVEPQAVNADPTSMTRATRSHRAGSTATQTSVMAEPQDEVIPTRTATGTRKKVTFQDLPEDDKENQPLAGAKSKKLGMQKMPAKSTTTATGLRAKPVRKAATSGVTKAKKVTTSSKLKGKTSASAEQSLSVPRALTPKKITQVAKALTNDDIDERLSDDEDELNGGKTPVRDLSMSPRRPLSSKLAQAISPSKQLAFDHNLAPGSPSKSPTAMQQLEQGRTAILASPARRLPASPFKDALNNSPKRGVGDSTKLLFPSHAREHAEGSVSIAANPANSSGGSQYMSTLLQSPKRSAVLDPSFFSQSAMKASSSKSPFKSSLLASPAKRLFSPSKKSNNATPKISDLSLPDDPLDDAVKSPAEEIAVSSHFRASASPVRVQRVEVNGSAMDFDESILQVGSPMKVHKSPTKTRNTAPALSEHDQPSRPLPVSLDFGVITDLDSKAFPEVADDGPSIDPSQLENGPVSAEDVYENTSDKPEQDTSETPAIFHDDEIEAQTTLDEDGVLSPAQHQESMLEETIAVGHRHDKQESSEDELAADETPVQSLRKPRASLAYPGIRQSLGVPSSAAGKGYGFTPLAAQMRGWLASSPQKTPKSRRSHLQRHGSFEFTPVAGQHVDGEVLISRDSTPIQKLDKRASLGLASSVKIKTPAVASRSPLQRHSLGESVGDVSSIADALVPAAQFEEYMEMRDAIVANDLQMEESFTFEDENGTIELETTTNDQDTEQNHVEQDENETILVPDDPVQEPSVELTTDLINFTHASDTAMIDFQKLADEANDLAHTRLGSKTTQSAPENVDIAVGSEEATQHASSDDEVYENENVQSNHGSSIASESNDYLNQFPLPEKAPPPELQPTAVFADSPSMLVIDQTASPSSSLGPEQESLGIAVQSDEVSTPVRPNIGLGRSRIINTVVSKIPLKPEGYISPIKIPKKRARSFGDSNDLPAKRLSLGSLKPIAITGTSGTTQSPDRQIRTSVAPSPGGTSTPATRYSRRSLGGMSAVTTPGQTSFVVDDFGDSTLDGIEMPDDTFLDDVPDDHDAEPSLAMSEKTFGLASMMATPRAQQQRTPATSKRSVRRVTAPASVVATPATVKKTPQRNSTNTMSERTPLQPVGTGLLSGATVYVDVHTSEGADASGIFIELLTQMGARCVKEWRWNSRASIAGGAEGEIVDQNIGITHVVYKDGGKRTLEKVRDAKGEVLCVGVAWVLDCERESKWLDESSYAVDISLAPRGGSRRRKSMQPHAVLIGQDGSVSAGKPRRSVSAEMSELMKRELVNTPARGKDIGRIVTRDDNDDDNDDDLENEEIATPTGFISYDPRTAMTPGTPYLVSQGKSLVQMSAPPKQTGKRLFEDDDEDEDEGRFSDDGARGLDAGKSVSDAKKFRMKNLDMKSRRRTLGFKPVVGSPLSRV